MRNIMTLDRFRYVFVAHIVYASARTLLAAPQLAAAHAAGRRAGA